MWAIAEPKNRPELFLLLQAGELQSEALRTCSKSNEAIEVLEQTMAELRAEKRAAEEGAEEARQALAAMQAQLKQVQGQHAAMASEQEWALESSGALQVS